ncbi:radical SAM/SPASM domain-containing protein [Streptococcus moroccensis]|uniref:Radical SAM core domain-containing protein n=1 Tax=Streptococcus moroccensis TaxID=1451356 RepID=A0ABT9YRA6_9STRE|nr:SPASM domain-containing protein [Streptococcus moroccensis]MDQ0221838.1 uncharacterized protein [Streptococcus moroccensis]
MKHISVMIKPTSSICNIRCKYCFYADVSSMREVTSYGKMTPEITKNMIEQIYLDLEDGDKLTLTFQGGEPTLAGLSYFENLVEVVNKQEKKINVQYAIQTNGMIITERWCSFFKKHNFLIGLSIDGLPEFHDLSRIDVKKRGTYFRVKKTKELFEKYQLDFNILCVLTNLLAREPKKVYKYLKEEKIEYVQFIPCLDDLIKTKKNKFALTPQRFLSFYKKIFELWMRDLEKGQYISIKLFDDIYNLFVNGQVNACGMLGNCSIQYVIEADGSVFPCDFYVLDDFKMGNIQNERLRELFNSKQAQQFISEKNPINIMCHSCPFKEACYGGCKRMKDAMFIDEKYSMCGYRDLLKIFIPNLRKINTLLNNI